MKVLVNGGLNLSELDGWWAEAYNPAVGWAIGDGAEHGSDPHWDAQEANGLYALLENEIVPMFYTRDAGRRPAGLDGVRAREHGDADTPVLLGTHGPAVRRGALRPRSGRLPRAHRRATAGSAARCKSGGK